MFTLGLKKIADNAATGGTNNQGLQFGGADETPYGAGAALFAPTGIPSYQPTGGEASKKKNKDVTAAKMIAISKFADESFMRDTGNMSDSASTLATQLKWDTNTAFDPQNLGLDKSGPRRKKKMNFIRSMLKEASVGETLKNVAKETWVGSKAFAKGLRSTGSHTIGDTLSFKGLKHLSDAGAGAHKTPAGRRRIAESIGKAAPSLAVGGAGVYAAKKIYDKTIGSSNPYMDNNYAQY